MLSDQEKENWKENVIVEKEEFLKSWYNSIMRLSELEKLLISCISWKRKMLLTN